MMSSRVEEKITKIVPIVCGSQVKGSNKKEKGISSFQSFSETTFKFLHQSFFLIL